MANEIRHVFHLKCKPDAVIKALTEASGIQKWWTTQAQVFGGVGVFQWKDYGWTVELVIKRGGAGRVDWACRKSNMQNTNAWESTTMRFAVTPEGEGVRLDFAQVGYRDSPCYNVCSEGWKFFLGTSLKLYLETGTGAPYPLTVESGKKAA